MFRAYHMYYVLQMGEELLHSLRCLSISMFQGSANTIKRNRVEKGQHGNSGSCLAKCLFSEKHWSWGDKEWLRQRFPFCAQGGTVPKRTKKWH